MSGFAVKGWCPDAWRPMMAGDGLLVRVKPRLGLLIASQVLDLCDMAQTHGNGLIDVTRRANLQLRGVREAGWQALLDHLLALGLVDADPVREGRRSILVAPEWRTGDDTHRIATELLARLEELPDLPGKVGLVVDAGPTCVLRDEAGDFRIERGETGDLIVRADGRARGFATSRGREVDDAIALAHWFLASGGPDAGRMARHDATLPDWATGDLAPASAGARTMPGSHILGAAYGLPFGRIEATVLAKAVARSCAHAVRFTPWRVMILEGAQPATIRGLIDAPADPLLHADACPGAPGCPQATVETRDLARALAPLVAGRLHVSGCAKGCARSSRADVTLTGQDGRFDLGLNARAGSPPLRTGLSQADLLRHFGAA